MRLQDKVIIVTGSARNIGKEIAKGLAEEGAKIVVADINYDQAAETATELANTYNVETLPVKSDVTNLESIDELVATTMEKFGRIDVLVNNAGVQLKKLRLEEMTEAEWDITMNVNNRGMVFLSKAVAEVMKKQGGGKIINTSSINQIICSKDNMAYIVSKNAVHGITKQMAADLAEYNINVNGVGPGYINTEMNKVTFSIPGRIEQICQQIPLGRIAEPSELAKTFVFLASSDSDYITGQVIIVDGGYTLL